jgi:hypothetical protein
VRSLATFTADLLSETGAVVEPSGHGLEALLPADVSRLLEAPEHVKLSFSQEGEGIRVSFDSDFFKKMARLLGSRGQFSAISLPASPLRPEKLGDRLDEKIILRNAVFHLERSEQKRISYLLAYFKYTARSDDRQEGIFASLINEFNLSVSRPPSGLLEFIASNAEEPLGEAERENADKVLRALSRAQREIVAEALKDFLLSLERRLNRDIRRVHDYYQTLMREHREVLEKKASTTEEKEKIHSRIKAIERELEGKVQDLIDKYHLNLQIEPISFIRVETVTQVFWLLVKRRKEARLFPLTYNPILRSLDSLPCEVCFYPRTGHSVCDDRLHIICKQCFCPCCQCGKIYCGACHPKGCPRCGGLRVL